MVWIGALLASRTTTAPRARRSLVRISFDIDDTLICSQDDAPREPNRVPRLLRPWFRESLRAGARDLMRGLAAEGHEIWVYTTSLRDPARLKLWFRLYGIPIRRVINDAEHDRIMARLGFTDRPSKYPSHFNIDLHVDDSEGVALEGRRHGFAVVVVSPTDPDWAMRVRAAVAHHAR